MLTLPAEEKPHLILAGLAFPTRPFLFDDLNEEDADKFSVTTLLSEMTSEIGYPLAICSDLDLYAIQLYRRLLLQWPLQMIELNQQASIERLACILRNTFGTCYRDSPPNRRQVLQCCVECFPFILASFYDCWREKRTSDVCALEQGAWSFEEAPFIVPPPWHNATTTEIAQGTLLLRDPSNAWRLRFWNNVFCNQETVILHLIRDPRESIRGLCDGWNYSFGFQTLPSDAPLHISGYTERSTDTRVAWKQYRLNFSVDRQLSHKLLERAQPMRLVDVCAHQWLAAHQQLMDDSDKLGMRRIRLSFSALRADPVNVFAATCLAAGLEVSPSGIAYCHSFSSRLVMATSRGSNWTRWRDLPYAAEIRRTVEHEKFCAIIWRLSSPPVAYETLVMDNINLRDAQSAYLCASV